MHKALRNALGRVSPLFSAGSVVSGARLLWTTCCFPLQWNNTAVSAACVVGRGIIQRRLGDLGLSRKGEIKAGEGGNDGSGHSSLMQQQGLVAKGGNVRRLFLPCLHFPSHSRHLCLPPPSSSATLLLFLLSSLLVPPIFTSQTWPFPLFARLLRLQLLQITPREEERERVCVCNTHTKQLFIRSVQ